MNARLDRVARDVPSGADDLAALPRHGQGRRRICLIGLVAALTGAGFAQAEPPQALLERYNCTFCHSDNEGRTGPAFSEVAAKYRAEPQAVARLVAAVKKGAHGDGPWHMPPHPEVSDADAAAMVRYILSVEP